MQLKTRGIAMIAALGLLVVVFGLVSLMATRTLGEIQHSQDNLAVVQTLMLARGGANLAGKTLVGPVRDDVEDLVKDIAQAGFNSTNKWVIGGNGDKPNAKTVVDQLNGVASTIQTRVDSIFCNTPITVTSNAQVNIEVFVTQNACGSSTLPSGVKLPAPRFVDGVARNQGTDSTSPQVYSIPYVMISEATATSGDFKRRIILQGEYQFTLGRSSFARYALFTNRHIGASGGDVWFNDRTLFDGPVHTNENFRFAFKPWFGDAVTSAGCIVASDSGSGCVSQYGDDQRYGGVFAGNSNGGLSGYFFKDVDMNDVDNPVYTSSNCDSNGYNCQSNTHAPDLAQVDWRSGYIKLPQNSDHQSYTAKESGLFIEGDAKKISLWAGDVSEGVVTSGNAAYQYIEVTEEKIQNETVTNWRWKYKWTCDEGLVWNRWARRWVNSPAGSCGYKYVKEYYTYTIPTSVEETNLYRTSKTNPNKLELKQPDGTWATAVSENGNAIDGTNTVFSGLVYVNGDVDRLTGPSRSGAGAVRPAIASFSKLTIAAKDDARITGDIAYESSPCSAGPTRQGSGSVSAAVCNNLSVDNVFGLYSDAGDVRIGNNYSDSSLNAPSDVVIHGSLMSGNGVVTVDNYNSGSHKGDVQLLGGIIANRYGAFGTFNSTTGTGSSGYSRNFTYDPRLAEGLAPPHFPVILQDELQSVFVFSYGQREQVY